MSSPAEGQTNPMTAPAGGTAGDAPPSRGSTATGESSGSFRGRVLGTQAQPEGQIVTVDSFGGFLGVGYLFSHDKSTGSDVERTEHILQEKVGLGAAGSMYSRNFLEYELSGAVGPSQDWAEDGSDSEYDSGELYEAEAAARFFPTRFHPLDLYYSRFQDVQPRVFLSEIDVTTTTAQAIQRFEMDDGNVRLEASRRETDQKVFGSEEPFADITEDTLGASADYRFSERQSLATAYTYRDIDQTGDTNDFTAHSTLTTHDLYLDPERDNRLRSRLETRHQDGDLDQELIRWTELFDSRINDDLDGDVLFRYEKNDTNIVDQELLRGEGGLQHRLFESLNSSVRIYGERTEANEESTTDAIGSTVNLNYRKTTPFGLLRMNYTNFLERRWVENDQGGAIDEPHTFPLTPPEEVRLLRSNIDPASIVVTDPSGLIFYGLNADYTIRQDAAGITTLVRVFTGLIPPGGAILVDYTFRTGADFTLDTVDNNFRAEHEFLGGLVPFFAFRRQDQDITDLEGPDAVEPVREQSLIGGLEWRFSPYLLSAEYEERKSTVLPFEAVRLRADAAMQFADRHTLTASAAQVWIFYDDNDRDVRVTQGDARWRSNIDRDLSFYLESAVRHENDSLEGDTFAYSVGGGLEYRWRQLSVHVRAHHRETRGVTSDFRGAEVGIWIVREFGGPPPSVNAAVNRFLRR